MFTVLIVKDTRFVVNPRRECVIGMSVWTANALLPSSVDRRFVLKNCSVQQMNVDVYPDSDSSLNGAAFLSYADSPVKAADAVYVCFISDDKTLALRYPNAIVVNHDGVIAIGEQIFKLFALQFPYAPITRADVLDYVEQVAGVDQYTNLQTLFEAFEEDIVIEEYQCFFDRLPMMFPSSLHAPYHAFA